MTIALDDGHPSPSAEYRFREIDDVFLQNQTRIWIGEILQTRLDEERNISELLADGELLFEVSEVLQKLLLSSCIEISHSKEDKVAALRNISRRYKPYSNVDSFLKICNFFGLDSVDLFSPPDVVEKKNTRRVCMCIRSLSKKARSQKLNVPDFDIVTHTISMSTCVVGCLRRSLELAQFSHRDSFGKLKHGFLEYAADTKISCSNDKDASITSELNLLASTQVEAQSDDQESKMEDTDWNHFPGGDDDIVEYLDSEVGYGRGCCDEIEDLGISSSPGSASSSVSNGVLQLDFEMPNNLKNGYDESQIPIPELKSGEVEDDSDWRSSSDHLEGNHSCTSSEKVLWSNNADELGYGFDKGRTKTFPGPDCHHERSIEIRAWRDSNRSGPLGPIVITTSHIAATVEESSGADPDEQDKKKVEGDIGLSRTLLGVAMSSTVAFGLFFLFDHFRKNQIRGAVKRADVSSSLSKIQEKGGKENRVYSADKLRLG